MPHEKKAEDTDFKGNLGSSNFQASPGHTMELCFKNRNKPKPNFSYKEKKKSIKW